MKYLLVILIMVLQMKDLISIMVVISLLRYHLIIISFYLSIFLYFIKLRIDRMAYHCTFLKPYLVSHQYI